jgi:mannosyltransferase
VPLSTLLGAGYQRTGFVPYLSTVPPSFNAPYYVVLHVWSSIAGTSAFALRVPSLLCAVAAVAVLSEMVRRHAGPGAALLCGLLCATGPLLADEAIQARAYGPAVFALSVCALWFTDWLRRGGGLLRVGLAAAAAGLLHWFTLPVLIGFAVAAVVEKRHAGRRAAGTLLVAGVPAAVLAGWSLMGGAAGAPSPAAVGTSLSWHALADWSRGFWPLSVLLVVAAVTAIYRSASRVLLLCWVVVPLALLTGAELVRPIYFARYALFALLGLAVAAALGVAAVRSTRWRRAVGIALVCCSALALGVHAADPAREPSDQAVQLLAAGQQPGEPIVAADGRAALDLETNLEAATRLQADLVLPPTEFDSSTASDVAWLVRVVVHEGSIPILPAEQRFIDAGWRLETSTLLPGLDVDLRLERWIR